MVESCGERRVGWNSDLAHVKIRFVCVLGMLLSFKGYATASCCKKWRH